MAPILNLPSGFGMASVRLGGNALPNGALFTFGFATTGGSDTPAAAATSIVGLLTATGAPFNVNNTNFTNSATFIDVLVKFGPMETGPEATASSGSVLGNLTGDAEPPSVAVLINKNTILGGRRGRGRCFVPGLGEGAVGTGGFLVAGNKTSIQNAFTQFAQAMVTATRPTYLLHRHDPSLGQSPVAPTFIESWLVQSQVATQRQRLRR